jgi:hypothetical protein
MYVEILPNMAVLKGAGRGEDFESLLVCRYQPYVRLAIHVEGHWECARRVLTWHSQEV